MNFIKKFAIDNDSKSFINEYKNIIIESFKEINHILTTYEINSDEKEINKLSDEIIKNYNNYNDNDNEKNDKIVIKDKTDDQKNCNEEANKNEDGADNIKLVKVFVVLYFINYYNFLLFHH